MNQSTILPLRQALHCLTLFQSVKSDEAVKLFANLISAAGDGFSPEQKLAEYHHLAGILLEKYSITQPPPAGDLWQNHLLNLILLDDNLFTREAAAGREISPALREACLHDLRILQILCKQGLEALDTLLQPYPGYFKMNVFAKTTSSPTDEPLPPHTIEILNLKQRLLQSDNWPDLINDLLAFFPRVGLGDFALYRAFRWKETPSGYRLRGIESPDPICFQQLIGYQHQRKQVINNTERLLQGLTAHNLLLYGDRGTGKSSTVKALLHEYGSSGLRLVQISKKNLGSLQELTQYLSKLPLKYIIFIDDLSFEEKETEYKEFKTQMEGSLEQQPANLRIYVTSNQRHLIKENFGDRSRESTRSGEVHPGDTAQEKLSLADRFGLRVTFPSPDKATFLEIVRKLALQENIMHDIETLEKLALQWTLWHNERSGRTARQFIDHLKDRKDISI